MGRIISNFFIALDGVVEAPDQWHFPYFNDEMGAVVGAGMDANKAFLMGRKGYDEGAAYWPGSTDEPFATYFNTVPKYVISSSLENPAWNNTTVLPGDVDAVRQFKGSIDGDIGMSGSATTVRWLLANGLLDELRLLCTRSPSVTASACSRTRRRTSSSLLTAARCRPAYST